MSRTGLGSTTLTLALATAALAATGCGGAKGLNRTELIAKADPICRRANDRLHASKMSPSRLATVAQGLAASFSQASGELARLTPPSSMAADWKVIVHGFQVASEGFAKAGRAARNKDQKALFKAETELTTGQDDRTVTAQRDGFGDCSRF